MGGYLMVARVLSITGAERDVVAVSKVCVGTRDQEMKDEDIRRGIHKLIRMRHWSPFEFSHLVIEIEAPIYVMRQWMRHNGPWMEKSRRYTTDEPVFEKMTESGEIEEKLVEEYNQLLEVGEKPESARKILPVGLYTHVIWNPNLRDFLNFIRLRTDPHAQLEIRELAKDLWFQVSVGLPHTYEAFNEWELGEKSFSIEELRHLVTYLTDNDPQTSIMKGIIKNAENRISMVEGVLDRVSPEVGDSTEDSNAPESTPSDSEKVSEEV